MLEYDDFGPLSYRILNEMRRIEIRRPTKFAINSYFSYFSGRIVGLWCSEDKKNVLYVVLLRTVYYKYERYIMKTKVIHSLCIFLWKLVETCIPKFGHVLVHEELTLFGKKTFNFSFLQNFDPMRFRENRKNGIIFS